MINKKILGIALFSSILSSCSYFQYSFTWNALEDNKRYCTIYNEESPSQFKFAVEISIDSPNSKIEFNSKSFRIIKDKTIYYSIGFASSIIHYQDKYFYNGIKESEEADKSIYLIYPLFDIEIGDNKLFYNSFELAINKTLKF